MLYAIPMYTKPKGQPVAYRAEYNVMSGRWMVLDANDVCHRAGLSEHKAKAVVSELTQTN